MHCNGRCQEHTIQTFNEQFCIVTLNIVIDASKCYSKTSRAAFLCRSNAELAKAEVAHLKELEQHLQQALHIEAEWWTKPTASFVGAAFVGSQQKD